MIFDSRVLPIDLPNHRFEGLENARNRCQALGLNVVDAYVADVLGSRSSDCLGGGGDFAASSGGRILTNRRLSRGGLTNSCRAGVDGLTSASKSASGSWPKGPLEKSST